MGAKRVVAIILLQTIGYVNGSEEVDITVGKFIT